MNESESEQWEELARDARRLMQDVSDVAERAETLAGKAELEDVWFQKARLLARVLELAQWQRQMLVLRVEELVDALETVAAYERASKGVEMSEIERTVVLTDAEIRAIALVEAASWVPASPRTMFTHYQAATNESLVRAVDELDDISARLEREATELVGGKEQLEALLDKAYKGEGGER